MVLYAAVFMRGPTGPLNGLALIMLRRAELSSRRRYPLKR